MTKNKPHDHYTTPQSLSLELRHVGMISDLVQATGMTRSAIARLAIEEYYSIHSPEMDLGILFHNMAQAWGVDDLTAHIRIIVEWNSARVMRSIDDSEAIQSISNIQFYPPEETPNDRNS